MKGSSFRRAPRMKLLCALVASCFAAEGLANPTGPAVASGTASFNNVGKTLTVTNSPNAIINWQGFSIGAGEATRFQQQSASSAVLNRVVGQDPSAILGTLWSNGRVFLVNPNGILFGQGSRVDVGGLVASTLNITNSDFLAGRLNFQAGAVANSIVNHGEIVSASGGRIYLIAPDVQNHGLISSPGGEVVLAAGKSVSLVDADVPNLQVEVQAGGEALNVGKILAEGGKAGIYAGLINQRGIVRADSVSKDATGRIVFRASDTTILDEGSVTSAAGAKGGEIQILGNKVGLVGTAQIDASGDAGGGTVLVGGDYQGKNAAIPNAYRTYFGPDATIKADAIASGDGGKVIVWADDATRAYGMISARGGALSGNGGFVEVSGKNFLDYQGLANLSAPSGQTGKLLLDPSEVTLDNSISDLFQSGSFIAGIFSGAIAPAVIRWVTIATNMVSSDVSVTTTGSGGTGNITIGANSPDLLSNNMLRLLAHNDIAVNGTITNTGAGSVQMYAGWNGSTATPGVVSGTGTLSVTKNITVGNNFSSGGGVSLQAGKDISISSSTIESINNNSTVSLNAVGGKIDVLSSSLLTPGSGSSITLNAGTGITVNNSTISAGSASDFSGIRSVSLTAVTGITINNSSTVGAFGSSSGATLPAAAATVTLNATGPGSTVSIADSQVIASVQEGAAKVSISGPGISINNSSVTSTASDGAAVAMTSTGNILIDNTTISATSTSSSQPAQINIDAGGSVTITNASSVVASSSDTATVDINGTTGIAVNGTSFVQAFGSGTTSVSLQTTNTGTGPLFGAINIDNSEVTAKPSSSNPLSTVTMNAAGPLLLTGATVEAYSNLTADVSLTAGGNLTVSKAPLQVLPVVEVRGGGIGASTATLTSAANVVIGGDILSDTGSGTASISVSATSGAITSTGIGGILTVAPSGTPSISLTARASIGTPANPVRIQDFATLTGNVFNTGTTGDIALSFVGGSFTVVPSDDFVGLLNSNPNGTYFFQAETGDVLLGVPFTPNGAALLAGQSVIFKAPAGNVSLNAGGSILASGSGNVTLEAGNHLSIAGPGTQVTGNNVTFLANDMDIAGSVVAATSATLAPFDLTTNMTIKTSSLGLCGMLCLGPAEIQNVSAPTLTLGRSDSASNIFYLDEALTSANYNVASNTGLLRLRAAFIYENGSGGIGGPFNHSLELRAGGNIDLAQNSINLGDNNNLSILAGQDFSGNLNIGGVTLAVGTGAGNTTGQMILQGQNINAIVSGGGSTFIGVFGTGAQSITATGDLTVQNSNVGAGTMLVQANGGAQTINVGGAFDIIAGTGTGTTALVQALSGTQTVTAGTLLVRGGASGSNNAAKLSSFNSINNQTVSANAISVEGGAAGGGFGTGNVAVIESAGSQTVNVGSGGAALTAGGGEDNAAAITQFGVSGTTQAVNVSGGGAIVLQGGSSAATPNVSPHGARAQITGSGDLQTINFTAGGSIGLTAGTVGSRNYALILNDNAQTISGSPSIALTGGASGGITGNGNFARISSNAGTQTISASSITMNGGAGGEENLAQIGQFGLTGNQNITVTGNLMATGGSGGFNNFSRVRSLGVAQTVSAAGITLTGGAAGGADGAGNFAQIVSETGSQTITVGAGGLHLAAGAGGIVNFASIEAPVQDIAVLGDLSLTGGGSDPGTTGAGARIGGRGGASATPTNLVLSVDGDVTLIGGSVAGATGSAIGSASLATAQRTDISMTVGGNVTLTSGTASGTRIGSSGASASDGDISITAGGNVAVNGGTTIRTLGTLAIDAGGALVLTGSSSGSGQSAAVFSGGNQTIIAKSITLDGGDNGGADLSGNFAQISSNGVQTVTTSAGDLTLNAGAAGINNFASITAPTQTVTVHGNLFLAGGGSATSIDGTIGGGARIGGPGGASPATTNLTLGVDGNVHLTGGTLANAGSAIGSGTQGGQATAITMTAGGNVTLDPGTVANGGSRIGSPGSGMAGGDISVTAGGTIALNSTGPGLGTAIRTLGNVTLAAASITQGLDSVIISGGTTSLTGGSISLTSTSNDFTGAVSITGSGSGNVAITDANGIVLGASSLGTGTLDVIAGGSITQTGPIVQAAGAGAASFQSTGGGAITLTNASNDFTGPVDTDTTSTIAITDANSFIIKGGGTGGSGPLSFTLNANGTVSQSAAFSGAAPAVVVINAGVGPIVLNNPGNDFTGNSSVAANTTGAASLINTNAAGINLAASSVGGALSLTSGGPVTQSGAITVGGTSTINAGSNPITLTNASNDFTGAVSLTGSNVAITDVNAISIGTSSVSGTLNIVATSTSFLNGFSANNYSFSGGSYTLAAGTYNLGGTTTIAGATTVVGLATGATINTLGGTVQVVAGGTLSGTGTIVGNVNNSGGTVAPGSSPGILTINGNYVQGLNGTLAVDVGGTVAGAQYDQLKVIGNVSLDGNLVTTLIGGYSPTTADSYTFISATGTISGQFANINQPPSLLPPVTTLVPATGGADLIVTAVGPSIPTVIAPTFNYAIVSTEQLSQPVIELLEPIAVSAVAPAATTTTTPEGTLVPKPPACN